MEKRMTQGHAWEIIEYFCDAMCTVCVRKNGSVCKECHLRQEAQLIVKSILSEDPEKVKTSCEESFDRFWRVYPKKEKKQETLKAWLKLKPDEELAERIIKEVERRKQSYDWTKQKGAFVPMPSTYVNQRRWEDEWVDHPEEKKHAMGAHANYKQTMLTDEQLDKLIYDLDKEVIK